jgi:hypothetical protein
MAKLPVGRVNFDLMINLDVPGQLKAIEDYLLSARATSFGLNNAVDRVKSNICGDPKELEKFPFLKAKCKAIRDDSLSYSEKLSIVKSIVALTRVSSTEFTTRYSGDLTDDSWSFEPQKLSSIVGSGSDPIYVLPGKYKAKLSNSDGDTYETDINLAPGQEVIFKP